MSDIWEELRRDRESGARRLVAEYGNRLYAAALLLCKNAADAEELVFRSAMMLDAMSESCISTRFARPIRTGCRQISS